MIRYIFTKILNKKKLYLCLMLGIISIVMSFAMIMMFRDGSERKLIQKGFHRQREASGIFPAKIERSDGIHVEDIEACKDGKGLIDLIDKTLSSYENSWNKYLNIPVVASQRIVCYKNHEVTFSYRNDGHIDIGYLESNSGEDLSEHFVIVDGTDLGGDISEYTATGVAIPKDAIPCLISKNTADSLDLVVGELIECRKMRYGEEESEKPLLTMYVNGIIAEKDGDYFWGQTLGDLGFFTIISKEDFGNIAYKYPREAMYYQKESLDYRYIITKNVDEVDSVLKQFTKKDEKFVENITSVIKNYREEKKSVSQMLYVIVLPLVVLILVFIGMISFRIIDSERGELSTLRNRGLSKFRLIMLYLLQSFILAFVSLPIGTLLGLLFGRMVAGVDDFMGFSFGADGISVRDYQFDVLMLVAGAAGGLISIIMMMIPVLLFFKSKKTRRKSSTTPFWEKYFVDVILMVISVYLLFNYNKQIGSLSEGVINGDGIDPVIFINSTLFLFACGMLILRVIFYIVKLIFKMGEKKFAPVTYSGILQILRTRKSSSVISIFLVMTVAMSIFNAGLARTINANKEERIKYECGADVRISEHFNLTIVMPNGNLQAWKYDEPNYKSYEELADDGTFQSITKVVLYDRARIKMGSKEAVKVTIMGIEPKKFGETASLRDGLNEKHWYNYLNALSAEPEGVIISKNLANYYELKVGDSLTCNIMPPAQTGKTDDWSNASAKVVAIVDSFPGYEKYKYSIDEKGKTVLKENYLFVMNYTASNSSYGTLPYEVWAKTDCSKEEIDSKLKEKFKAHNRYTENIRSRKDDIKQEKSTAIIQITNGIFTADFLVALLLCVIGYMIYWLTSIRDRELLFGIYRAMGISSQEINSMIGLEQVFLSLMSILSGVFAGSLALKLFVKVFAAVYLPQKHNVPVFVTSHILDMLEIGAVLLVVIVICIIWIRRIVKSLNITEALKLGDD